MSPVVSVHPKESFSLSLWFVLFQHAYRRLLPPSGWLWSRRCV